MGGITGSQTEKVESRKGTGKEEVLSRKLDDLKTECTRERECLVMNEHQIVSPFGNFLQQPGNLGQLDGTNEMEKVV